MPGPPSVYVTAAPDAAAPEAALALEGPAVQPPDADGSDTVLVVLDGLGGELDPLPATGRVTAPPVPVEYVEVPPANAAAIVIDALEGAVPLVFWPAPALPG